MAPPSSDKNRLAFILLRESLSLWGTAGLVRAGSAPVVAFVHVDPKLELFVQEAKLDDAPIRWWVHSRTLGQQATRPRPCTSAVGMLKAVRNALGAAPGLRTRIAHSSGERP